MQHRSRETLQVIHASADVTLDADPASIFWREASSVCFDTDNFGRQVSHLTTQVSARWTRSNLYLLFVCPYRELHLKPQPQTTTATAQLWDWDVAEIFLGCDAESLRHYKEFEISPQGEWIDLDVDLDLPGRTRDADWSSGFEAKAQIDPASLTWYGAMRIPFTAISSVAVQAGMTFRANLFRSQGPEHQLLAWQPSLSETFHVPERFGELVLL